MAADSVVSSTITFVLDNLSRLLVEEAKLLSGVKEEISSLHDELKFMYIFLKNSEGKRNSELVKEVVSQIKDVAYQAEDVIDTYILFVNKHRRRNMFQRCFHCKDHVSMLHQADDQIKKIKAKIEEIYKNKTRYGIEEGHFQIGNQECTLEEAAAESLRKKRGVVEEEDVVGLVHESTVVIENLMRENPSLEVTSIIGMGGLGKTTLARKIYNKVKDQFSYCAWGYVSNNYRAKELLLSLLHCLNPSNPEYKDCNAEQLKDKVKECLKGKKYLIVLDDIWKTQVWDDVKEAFPNDEKGSRILITSRIKGVAVYSKSILIYPLPILSKDDSWHLFRRKVFGNEECQSDLEPLGREMVENCRGLPLAIIVLAGLVAKKDKTHREWMRIKNGVNWQLDEDKVVMDILKLSYDNLPQELKPCFLFFGIYPEDYEIVATELYILWITEGFIQPKKLRTTDALEPEDVADYYLDELVDRSLVQVARKRTDGGVRTCRIHDLLRELCISESKENKFMEACTELDIDKCTARRLSVHYKTYLAFHDGSDWDSGSKGWKWIKKSLKLARVLHISPLVIDCSKPIGFKSFIHLRYLRVQLWGDSRTRYNAFAVICNLWNLESLHIVRDNVLSESQVQCGS